MIPSAIAFTPKSRRARSSASGAALTSGSAPGSRVGLPPRGGQVERELSRQHLGGAEALVLASAAPEPVGERARDRAGVALHGHVDVHPVGAAQQVAHRAAHEVRGRQALERGQQPAHPRQAANALAQVLGGQHQSRTGIPAARMRSLASRTL